MTRPRPDDGDHPPGKRTRPGEKPRAGTCAFADRVASCAIDAYARAKATTNASSPLRTVLAAFVAHDEETDALRCVSLGVGTKTRGREKDDDDGTRIVDAHAEVLARRGLKRFLLRETRERTSASASALALTPAFLEVDEETDSGRGTARAVMRVKPGVSLHLYVSSAPCGNATVRRWAKGRGTKRRDDLGDSGVPREPHEKLQRSALDAGQVALCVKVIKSSKDEETPEELRRMIDRGELAPGTAPVKGVAGKEALTCSDKLCVWNVVGYQGALVGRFLRDPLYVDTITIGRKFSEPHLCRAMCCRVDGFVSACGGYATRHPALMETRVAFDKVPMDAVEGAVFENPFAMTWSAGDEAAEVLDGKTGWFLSQVEETGSSPAVCKARLFRDFNATAGNDDAPFTREAYDEAKRNARPTYDDAKTQLFRDWKMFAPRAGYPGWDAQKSKRWSGYVRDVRRARID